MIKWVISQYIYNNNNKKNDINSNKMTNDSELKMNALKDSISTPYAGRKQGFNY